MNQIMQKCTHTTQLYGEGQDFRNQDKTRPVDTGQDQGVHGMARYQFFRVLRLLFSAPIDALQEALQAERRATQRPASLRQCDVEAV